MRNYLIAVFSTVTVCLTFANAQIFDGNIWQEAALLKQSYRFDDLYKKSQEDSLVVGLSKAWGVEGIGGYQNSASDPYSLSADKGMFWASAFYQGNIHPLVNVKYRLRATNERDEYIDPNRVYWADEFNGVRGDIEVGAITFDHPNFRVKFGRDYVLPAVTVTENLMHSLYSYPYDQIHLSYRNDFLELSSYYLQLNATSDSSDITRRHFNGHRLRINLKELGYLAVNEMVIYGGVERNANPMFLNPFLGYYVYQKNARNFSSNTIITAEAFLKRAGWFTYLELLIDDFQVDNEKPSDLEPAEYGINWSVGRKDIVEGVHALANYTKVANRTYNAPFLDHEKYIYNNLPIGHFLGNNFWEMRLQATIETSNLWWLQAGYYHRKFGEEALYGEFNMDFLAASVEEGYDEAFPFGETLTQNGIQLKAFFQVHPKILAKIQFAQWFDQANLPEKTTFGLKVGFRL